MDGSMADRRTALAALGGAGLLAAVGGAAEGRVGGAGAGDPLASMGWDEASGLFVLPALPYAKEALEPHIDAATMEIHHGRHHKAYVDGLNQALGALKAIREGEGDARLVKHWSREVSFHGCGHINHCLFWRMMAPAGNGGGGEPTGRLGDMIARDFGSFAKFALHFKAAAAQVEGGGWAWLVVEPLSRRLMVIQGEKQQDLMLTGAAPVLGVDVWEHAYYLKYQSKRADYVNAFMNVVNWGFCGEMLDRALGPA